MTSEPNGPCTVLIVEDNPEILELTRLMLKGGGYQVSTASDGAEAIKVVEQEDRIDVVLMDVVLPIMGGRETAGHIATLSPATRCLFMSAYPMDSPPLAFINADNHAFIAKPFSTMDLRQAIGELTQPSHPSAASRG